MSETKAQFTFVFSTAHRMVTLGERMNGCCIWCWVWLGVVVASGDRFREEKRNVFNSLQLIIWFVCQLVIYRVKTTLNPHSHSTTGKREAAPKDGEHQSSFLVGRGGPFFL